MNFTSGRDVRQGQRCVFHHSAIHGLLFMRLAALLCKHGPENLAAGRGVEEKKKHLGWWRKKNFF